MDYVVCGLLIAGFVLLTVRNTMVWRERKRIAQAVYLTGLREIRAGRDAAWRWAEYDRVSYDEMVLKFWRPVSSFYAGARCLQPHEELT